MKQKLLKLLIIATLFILPTKLFAASPVYLPFELTASSATSEATKYNDAIVESSDAHWGWIEEYWSKGNGKGKNYGGDILTFTHYDGVVLGPKRTTAESSGLFTKTYKQEDSEGIFHPSAYDWDDKYIIIESKEVIGSIHFEGNVYTSAATPQRLKFFWYVYVTNDINNWGDEVWNSGSNKSVNRTINLTTHPNYETLRNNRYIVICYRGNFSAYISKLIINENTYLNLVESALPDEYSVYIGEYQSQDIVLDFCNLDGINNTDISNLTVTSSNPSVFSCIEQTGDAIGLGKIGTRNVSIRFNPTDDIPQTYYATITIKGGTSASSLYRTVNVVGHSYRQQKLIWNQNFSRLDISDADIPLTAYSSVGLTPVNYSSADPSVVTIVDGKLHIVGKGRTILTASQAGDGTYNPVSASKYVYVSAPGDPCEAYDLYEPAHVILHTIDEQVYELFGLPADKLTFDACRTLDAITSSAVTGAKYFKVAESYDNGKTWHELASFDDMPRSETTYIIWGDKWKNYTVQLSENATHIKIYTVTGATMRHHIRNVIVTQKSYIRPQTSPITISPEMGSTSSSTTLRVAYSSLFGNLDVSLKTPTDLFTLDHTEIPIPCGDVDTTNVVLTIHNVPCVSELRNSIILKNGDLRVEVPIIATPQKSVQIINWTSVPTGVTTSSELTVSDMGAMVAPRAINADYTSDNPEIADFDAYGNLIIKQPGDVTIRASQAGNECFRAAEEVTKTISIAQAHLIFDDKDADKDWFNANNWKPNRNVIPNHLAFATLEADVEIDDTKIAYAKRLTLDGNKLYIKADGNLHAETITDANTEAVLIELEEGNMTKAAGALATKSADVNAQVNIFVKGSNVGERPTWQYYGVPFSVRAIPAFYNAWVCEWSEAEGGWSYKKTSDILTPWTGYCITQPKTTEVYSDDLNGVIQTGNHTYELSYTVGSSYLGNNIMTNSYTAPIDITKLEEEDFVNVEKTIYIYNTGTHAQWESHKNDAVSSDALAGQYLAIPALEADYAPYDLTVIPSLQAFCLQATAKDASFTVDYNRTVWGSNSTAKPKRAPRRSRAEYSEDENLIIDINGSRFGDAISILKRDNCTGNYDDGHDAFKWDGNSLAPQLYSTEADNKIYAVDARETLEGHYIGLKPGEDNFYTLTFRLVETDDLYYLKDLTDNNYYPIIEGMEIEIEATTPMSHRFQIVNEIEYVEEQDKHEGVTTDLCMNNRTAFLTNSSDEVIVANVFDMAGKLVEQQSVAPHATFNYQLDRLPHGTYIINLGTQNLKVIR